MNTGLELFLFFKPRRRACQPILKGFVCLCLLFASRSGWAQSEPLPSLQAPALEDNLIDIDSIEKELEGNLPKAKTRDVPLQSTPAQPKVNYDELKKATPYTDLAVIQRNYMPKSKRFEAFAGLSYLTNDVFFKNFGLQGRFGYHVNETWGLELSLDLLSTTKSKELEGLEGEQKVELNNLVSPKTLYGGSVLFYSTYGKMARWNRKIFNFDIYTSVGATQILTGSDTSTALKLGVGELFSLNKSEAIRLDFSWYFYTAKNIEGSQSAVNNLFLTLGYSRFFPDVKER